MPRKYIGINPLEQQEKAMTLALKVFNMEALGGKDLIIEIVDVELAEEQVSAHHVRPQEENIFGVSGTRYLRVKHPITMGAS